MGSMNSHDKSAQFKIPAGRDEVRHYVQRLVDLEGERWPWTLAEKVAANKVDDSELFTFLSDVAWDARQAGKSAIQFIELESVVNVAEGADRFTLAFLYLQSHRYEFHHSAIRQAVARLRRADEWEELNRRGFLEGMSLFAEAASGSQPSGESMIELSERSNDWKVSHLLLHGMWLDPHGQYSDEMLSLADRLLELNPDDQIAWMRKAEAYRRKLMGVTAHGLDSGQKKSGESRNSATRRSGRYYAEKAVEAIDRAIELNDPSDTALHDGLVQQRLSITQHSQLNQYFEQKLTEIRHEIDGKTELSIAEVEKIVRNYSDELQEGSQAMLFRIMEIIALFVALIGLLATTVGVSVAGELSVLERLAILAGSSVFLIFFFVMVHVLARPKYGQVLARRREQERELKTFKEMTSRQNGELD